jgi:integrase/recombinase XerD
LRHEDIAAAEREISIVLRDNANGARAKSGGRTVPAGGELIRLYAGYLHEEYGGIGSDYVFVNIWAEPRGQAWSYPAVYDLVTRLRAKTGIGFDPRWFRHTAATRWLRDGVPVEVVSTLPGHSSVTVTSAIYGHLTAADARAALEKAGWPAGREVSW